MTRDHTLFYFFLSLFHFHYSSLLHFTSLFRTLYLQFRERGGPRLEWDEYVERLARKRGRKLPEMKRLVQDRKEYRKWLLEPDA